MLTEVLDYIHNWFVPIKADKVTYTVESGMISPAFGAEDGDRFLICGSRRNDGIYTWHADGIKDDDDINAAGLRDETFAGTIRAMAIPPKLIALSEEISQWVAKNSDVINSPYQSESFNGYSYSLRTGSARNQGAASPISWRDIYGKQLERWRKPSL